MLLFFSLFISIYNTKYKSNLFYLRTGKIFKTSLVLSIYDISVHKCPATFHKVDPQVVPSSYDLPSLPRKGNFHSSAQNFSFFLPAAQFFESSSSVTKMLWLKGTL